MNKLKLIRKRLNMTQKQLAEQLGVTRAQVANIEQGVRFITPRVERDLVTYLNVNPEWLETGKEPIILDKYSNYKLDSSEREFIDLFESLDDDSKSLILKTMKKIVSK